MINNALPNVLDDHPHDLASWRGRSSGPVRGAWGARLLQIFAQLAAWFRTRLVRRSREAPADPVTPLQTPAAAATPPLPPDDDSRLAPQQWPTKLLEIREPWSSAPSSAAATEPEPAPPLAPSSRSPRSLPTDRGEPDAGTSPLRRRHVIVTLPPPDFEAGPDYDPQPPPQGFSRETVRLDEAAARAGRLQVLRRLPAPASLRPRLLPQDEPLVMLLSPRPSGLALDAPATGPAASPPSPSPAPTLPSAPPTASLTSSAAGVSRRQHSAPAPRVFTSALPPTAPVRVPVRRKIVTLTRPEQPLVAPRQAAPGVVVEKPVRELSIEDCWIGEPESAGPPPPPPPPPTTTTTETETETETEGEPAAERPAGAARVDSPDLVEPIEWSASDSPAAVDCRTTFPVPAVAVESLDADVAPLAPAGEAEPNPEPDWEPTPELPLQFELSATAAEDEAVSADQETAADLLKVAVEDAEIVAFEAAAEDEAPIEFGGEASDQAGPDATFEEITEVPEVAEVSPAEPIGDVAEAMQVLEVTEVDEPARATEVAGVAGVAGVAEATEAAEVAFPSAESPPEAVAAGMHPHAALPDDAPPPVEVARVLDLAPDASDKRGVEWLGQVAEDQDVVSPLIPSDATRQALVAAPVFEELPASSATGEASVEPMIQVPAVDGTGEPAAPGGAAAATIEGDRSTTPAGVPVSILRPMPPRRVIYVQDGAVLPLSARRLRRTMRKVRLPSVTQSGEPTRSALAPAVGPSTEAFHDDEL